MSTRNPRRIFLIAAEESGDRLGAGLMQSLRARLGDGVTFQGIGGRHMAEQGMPSLFHIDQLSIIGFAAIPQRLRLIWNRINAALFLSGREKLRLTQ